MTQGSSTGLIGQVAARLGLDGVFKELAPFIPSLQPPRNGRSEVRALCPDHNDHDPSWCWNLHKGLAYCHPCGTGTSFVRYIAVCRGIQPADVLDEFCKRFGLPRPRGRTLTLADYAEAKGLPVLFLKEEFMLSDGPEGLLIPYRCRDGHIIAQRTRKRFGRKPTWKTGTKASKMVYGLHGLDWIAQTRYVVVVEGESDLHTAWFYGFPALATPGASMGHGALATVIAEIDAHTVYALLDEGAGGEVMLEGLNRALRRVGWSGMLFANTLPAKDLSALHLECPTTAEKAIGVSISRAVLAEELLLGLRQRRKQKDSIIVELLEPILSKRKINSSDKVILMAAVILAGADASRSLGVTNARLARLSGLTRRTVQNRIPGLRRFGLLESKADGLHLGAALVK